MPPFSVYTSVPGARGLTTATGTPAAATLRYVANTLSDRADGGFYASQRACEPYYALDSRDERRAGAPPPPVDRTLFTGANASMVRAWLDAAEAFGDTALGEFAVQSLERVPASHLPSEALA